MKHITPYIIAWALCLSVYAQDKVNLTVMHTNDTHSCIQPLNPNFKDTTIANKAGYARRKVYVDELRKQDADLLLFDCGDFSQGSTYYNLFKGEVEIKMMNLMKYDAATIGNHEFDYGLSNMERIFKMADFPIICSNYDFSKTILKDVVKPYTIIHRKGIKIGVLAVCTRLKGLVSQKNSGETVYLDPITEGNKIADYLKNEEKCDLVICLSHLGWKISGVDVEDESFIKASRNIDIVLGGHSHSYFERPETVINSEGKPVICNQMGKHGQWVGQLDVEMKKK
ncbi:MAG: metallophosphatase [Bacteroidaceae bacterium]|nr:metallophosphatase [Bacteroidaceae bacterium]